MMVHARACVASKRRQPRSSALSPQKAALSDAPATTKRRCSASEGGSLTRCFSDRREPSSVPSPKGISSDMRQNSPLTY